MKADAWGILLNIGMHVAEKYKVRRKVWALEEKYMDFTLKRMFIFNELVKRYWKGTLNTASDLEELAVFIKDKYGFRKMKCLY